MKHYTLLHLPTGTTCECTSKIQAKFIKFIVVNMLFIVSSNQLVVDGVLPSGIHSWFTKRIKDILSRKIYDLVISIIFQNGDDIDTDAVVSLIGCNALWEIYPSNI